MVTYQKLSQSANYKTILERDKRYDGLFFFAVTTTRIYCRPSCPAPRPLKKNVEFYQTVDEARAHGYRACKRCHPDRLKDSEARTILENIQSNSSNDVPIGELAAKFNISERHLHRIVKEKTGTSPAKIRQAKRLDVARLLLTETKLPVIDVAFSSDFSSLRQFNHAFKEAFGKTPRELRTQGKVQGLLAPTSLNLKLSYKQPMVWQPLVNGLKAHTIPNLEQYDEATNTLTRYLEEDGHIALVTIDLNDYKNHVKVRVHTENLAIIDKVVARVRRLFDLDHNPVKANEILSRDPLLAPMITARPGLRIVGSFSPFELMISTIFGQQISVAAARTFTGRFVKAYGKPYGDEFYLFPTAKTIANADPMEMYERTKLNHKKIATLQTFAALVNNKSLNLEDPSARTQVAFDLLAIKGIGLWSVEYLALRGMGDPDAFPADDLLVKRRLGVKNAKEAIIASEQWRPFRGYGVMHIWAEGAYL